MAKQPDSLADQIRAAVRASGMTQRAVAQALGVSEPTLSKFLAGKTWLAEKTANDIARLLELRIVTGKSRKGR